MIAIPNMSKPKSCDECRILRAEFDGSYDKSITGCRQRMGTKNTLREEYDALILDCPLLEIVQCKECKYGILEDNDDIYRCEYNGSDWNEGSYFCSYGERRK